MKNTKICIAWLCFVLFAGLANKAEAGFFPNSAHCIKTIMADQDTTKKSKLDPETIEKIKKIRAEVDTLNKEMKAKNIDAKLKLKVDTAQYMHGGIDISDDGINISFGGKNKRNRKKDKHPNFETDFLGIDIGVNTFLYNNSLSLPTSLKPLEHSMGINNVVLHIVKQGVNIYSHNIYLTYGIDLDLNNYKFKNDYTILPNVDSFVAEPQNIKYSKNKLAADFVTVPVMLHFESNPFNPGKSFKIGVGGFAGLLYSSRTKQVSDEEGLKKVHDDFNLKKYRYGLSAQFGFSALNFYVNYSLSEMFEDDRGPKLAPVNFGIILLRGFRWGEA